MSPAVVMDAIDRAGHRLTGPRRAVAALVAGRDGPFTAAELEAEARRHNLRIGRATIFRTLDLMDGLGLVERLDLPSGEHAWVMCGERHHHHVVCSGCGRTTDFDDAGLAAVVAEVGRRTGFVIERHRLELFGRCAACQAPR